MKLEKIKKKIRKIFRPEGFRLYIDVANCGLRCAMCPRGGASGLKNEGRGLMDFQLFERVINKFIDEKVGIKDLEIGNWGEPLLNPVLPKMIRYAEDKLRRNLMDREGKIKINTTLNWLRDPIELLESGVNLITISTSGMTQDIYSRNHIGGNIDTVLSNILRLVSAKNERNISRVQLEMIFHDFIYNRKDAEIAEEFCKKHGLRFTRNRMYICSIEDNIKFHEEKERMTRYYEKFIDVAKEEMAMKTITDVNKCHLRRRVITINYDGQLYRCCGVFEEKYFMGSFFDYKIRAIPNIESAICYKCAKTPISFR